MSELAESLLVLTGLTKKYHWNVTSPGVAASFEPQQLVAVRRGTNQSGTRK